MEDSLKYLANFLGPKAENSEMLVKSIMRICQDYIHWRRNYYPADKNFPNKQFDRELDDEFDNIYNNTTALISGLRRNFPFYSPRYIAHMLSDITLPSMIGYFAGMLYNANNVTPEAAPVTVEWEIDACNEVLKMIGYNPSPIPPGKEAKKDEWEKYERDLKSEFAWAHITSGGTIANIEAMWVARLVKYFPLAIFEVAQKYSLEIELKTPKNEHKKVTELTLHEIVNIKPNESIYLLAKYVDSVAKKFRLDLNIANTKAFELLKESSYNPANNLGKAYNEFPPVIFASGAAHYCIKKAADILGIGRDNVIDVKSDKYFRMDIDDLERKIASAIKQGKVPVAVIGVAGTTEEGAVDPIHKIIDLRSKFELEKNISFWIHVDSAWGGYFSSLFKLSEEEEFEIVLNKVLKKLELSVNNFHGDVEFKITEFEKYVLNKIQKETNHKRQEVQRKALQSIILLAKQNKFNRTLAEIKELTFDLGLYSKKKDSKESESSSLLIDDDLHLTIFDRIDSTYEFIKDKIVLEYKSYFKEKEVTWGFKDVVFPFLAFSQADSVTIDPHKMGYMQYPLGVIAFKNDRIRHFITQRAPYITSSGHNSILHTPPRHINNINFESLSQERMPYEEYRVSIDAFAPFMLEGSKPGAAASSLWMATKSIPLNRQNHGKIIRASLLATRELYEWLKSWEKITNFVKDDSIYYSYHLVSSQLPDTNLIIFTIKAQSENSLSKMNLLTKLVYDTFTIQAELGDSDHSYSQPYFLSKTTFSEPEYDFSSLEDFFTDIFPNGDINKIKKEYKKDGLLVLRATLMNPYILAVKKINGQNVIKDFMIEMHNAANKAVKNLI